MSARQLGYSNARGGFSVDPGTPTVFVGTNSDDHALCGSFEVTGASRELRSSERSFFSTVDLESVVESAVADEHEHTVVG